MVLAESRSVNNVVVHGYFGEQEVWFTRDEIGRALGYAEPGKAIGKIHERHRERLDMYSRFVNLTNGVQSYKTYVYSPKGVFEICRWSSQPKADEVMDRLYDMAVSIMHGEWEKKSSPRKVEKPKLKPKVDWTAVALLSLNRDKFTRAEYHAHLIELFGTDRKGIANEMRLYDKIPRRAWE